MDEKSISSSDAKSSEDFMKRCHNDNMKISHSRIMVKMIIGHLLCEMQSQDSQKSDLLAESFACLLSLCNGMIS